MPPSDRELIDIAGRAAKAFVGLPNVHAVGVGGRERAGRPTGEVVLKVFVQRKVSPEQLPTGARVPAAFEGLPTDVILAGLPRRMASVPGRRPMSVEAKDALADESRERPLRGGTQIMPQDESGSGTLGFIAEALEDNRQVFAVTAFHVLFESRLVASTDVLVGQPTPKESCTACCRGVIGKYFGGFKTAAGEAATPDTLDYALVRLDPGLEWLNEVKEIGVVQDTYDLRVSDAVSLTYQIRKRGAVTRLTGSTLHGIGVKHLPLPSMPPSDLDFDQLFCDESVCVRPNDDPGAPGAPVLFADHGDSGSALINDANQLVGLLWGGGMTHDIPDPAVDTFGEGWGVPIGWIVDDIKTRLGLTLRILPTAGEGIVNTVPDFAGAISAVRAEAGLARDLDRTEQGREFLRAWLRHSGELNAIVQNQRRVATVWQRHNGSALLRLVAQAPLEPDIPLPLELDGVPVRDGLATFLDQVRRHASTELQQDLSGYRELLLSLPGRSYADVMRQMGGGPH